MRAVRNRRLRRQDEQGASLVEFALILPVFALLLFGMIDFGMVFGGFIALRNDVGAAARSAAVDYIAPSCTNAANPMICTIQNNISSLPGVVAGSVEVAIKFAGVGSVGQPVIVCAQATMHSLTGITGPILNGRTIHASTEMLIEQTPTYTAPATSTTGYSC